MSVLVIGKDGQVGRHLAKIGEAYTFWGREHCDLQDPASVEQAIKSLRPSAVINVAAYTAVDAAEAEPGVAWAVNAEAPAAMARAAQALGVPLVHLSTDFVFDGSKHGDYRSTDATGPVNAYGRTKLAGELAVRTLCERHWVLRTSWVFSEFGTNFVKTMFRLARERETIKVVADQTGCPTDAGMLASAICALLDLPAGALEHGIYNLSGSPSISRYGLAEEVVRRVCSTGTVSVVPTLVPISSSEYPTAARRPRNSALEADLRLLRLLHVDTDWRPSLDRVVRALLDDVASA